MSKKINSVYEPGFDPNTSMNIRQSLHRFMIDLTKLPQQRATPSLRKRQFEHSVGL
jgi:hypothetical protein